MEIGCSLFICSSVELTAPVVALFWIFLLSRLLRLGWSTLSKRSFKYLSFLSFFVSSSHCI